MHFVKMYFIALLSFLAIDFVWLGFIAKNLYQKELGYLLAKQVVWPAAIVFYLIFILGLCYFVIYPSMHNPRLYECFLKAAFFGLICYATYDLTNLATIKGWPLKIVFIDLAWGAFITGTVCVITCWCCQLLNKHG